MYFFFFSVYDKFLSKYLNSVVYVHQNQGHCKNTSKRVHRNNENDTAVVSENWLIKLLLLFIRRSVVLCIFYMTCLRCGILNLHLQSILREDFVQRF